MSMAFVLTRIEGCAIGVKIEIINYSTRIESLFAQAL